MSNERDYGPVKCVVAGSRTVTDVEDVHAILDLYLGGNSLLTHIISGTNGGYDARRKVHYGVDHIGELWAEKNGIKIVRVPADWHNYGPAAGPIRNRAMAEMADMGIVLLDEPLGKVSRGSRDMIRQLKSKGKPVISVNLAGGE